MSDSSPTGQPGMSRRSFVGSGAAAAGAPCFGCVKTVAQLIQRIHQCAFLPR
jgi:hypothetical protein